MTDSLPKAINCRLGVDDMAIKKDLVNYTDKTARVKDIYRMGLLYEAMERDTTLIPDKLTATCYRVLILDEKRKIKPEMSAPVLYTI